MPCHCLCDLLQDCHHEWQSTCDCYLFSFLWELLSLKLLKITLYIRFCSRKGQCKAVNWKVVPDVTQGMKMVQLLLIKWSPILSNLTCALKLIWELHSTKGKGPVCSEQIFSTMSNLSLSSAHPGIQTDGHVWETSNADPSWLFKYKSLRIPLIQQKMTLGMILSFWLPSDCLSKDLCVLWGRKLYLGNPKIKWVKLKMLVCKLAPVHPGQGEMKERGRSLQIGRWQI